MALGFIVLAPAKCPTGFGSCSLSNKNQTLWVRRRSMRWSSCETSLTFTERSSTFSKGTRFYRENSRIVRDLGVLAAIVLSEKYLKRKVRCADVCSGSGVRALRYLEECPTSFVLANDPQTTDLVLQENLAEAVAQGKAEVTTDVARVCLRNVSSSNELFDVVDVDGFGAGGSPTIGDAIEAVKPGGLLYMSASDSVSVAGRNREVTIAAYGAFAGSHPAVNEQMLRFITGTAMREGAARRLSIYPVFSYFHAPSHTARIMLRVEEGRPEPTEFSKFAFVTHCRECLQNNTLAYRNLAGGRCVSCGADPVGTFVISGPLWTGPLHERMFLRQMGAEAHRKGWTDVEMLLRLFSAENKFPPLYYRLGDIGKRIGAVTPPRRKIEEELNKLGYRSSGAHALPRSIKTDAPVSVLIEAAKTAVKFIEEAKTLAEKRLVKNAVVKEGMGRSSESVSTEAIERITVTTNVTEQLGMAHTVEEDRRENGGLGSGGTEDVEERVATGETT